MSNYKCVVTTDPTERLTVGKVYDILIDNDRLTYIDDDGDSRTWSAAYLDQFEEE